MTREDAFEIWLPIIKMGVKSMPECSEALDMAINALKQEPCTDAISRQAAIYVINHAQVNFSVESEIDFTKHEREVHEIIENVLGAQEKALKELPPVKPVEKVGRWIDAEVLDKIIAEIIKYEDDCRLSVDEYPSCKQCTDNTFETIYAILDKYKAESEGGTQHDD